MTGASTRATGETGAKVAGLQAAVAAKRRSCFRIRTGIGSADGVARATLGTGRGEACACFSRATGSVWVIPLVVTLRSSIAANPCRDERVVSIWDPARIRTSRATHSDRCVTDRREIGTLRAIGAADQIGGGETRGGFAPAANANRLAIVGSEDVAVVPLWAADRAVWCWAGNRCGWLALVIRADARTRGGVRGAIVAVAATIVFQIDTGIVVSATCFSISALGCAMTVLAGGAIAAIGPVLEWLVDTNVVLAGDRIAVFGGAIVCFATTTGRVETGIATCAAEQSVWTTGAAGIVGADLLDGTALFFGDADGTGVATGVVATLFGGVAAIGTAGDTAWTDAFATVPDLLTRALDWFRGRSGTTSGEGRATGQSECRNSRAAGTE